MKGKQQVSISSNDEGNITVSLGNTDIEYTIESLGIDPNEISYNRGTDRYTPEQKIQCVMYYLALGGNATKVSKKTGVPANTIRKWKSTSPWWGTVMSKARTIKQDELDAMFTNVIHNVVDELQDRIINGDHKYDSRTGQIVRVPVTAKDLAVIQSMTFDKRSLLRGDPTNIRKETTSADNLKEIQNKLLKTLEAAKEQNVVSQQPPEFEDNE